MPFDIARHAHCFKTAPDEAYFWHGQTTIDGVTYGGSANAMRIAEENVGKTLEMCMLKNREELTQAGVNFRDRFDDGIIKTEISYGNTKEDNDRFWKACSQSFAKQASGDVYVIEGTDTRKIYDTVFSRGTEFNKDWEVEERNFKDSIYAKLERSTLTAVDNEKLHSIAALSAVDGREQGLRYDRNIEKNIAELKEKRLTMADTSLIDERIEHLENSYGRSLEMAYER